MKFSVISPTVAMGLMLSSSSVPAPVSPATSQSHEGIRTEILSAESEMVAFLRNKAREAKSFLYYGGFIRTEHDIASDVASGKLIELSTGAATTTQDMRTLKALKEATRKMKMPEMPALYLDTTDKDNMPHAEVKISWEGRPYIIINAAARDNWSAAQLEGIFGHEEGHLLDGDDDPKNIRTQLKNYRAWQVRWAYDSPNPQQAIETKADRRTAQGCLGPELISALQAAEQINLHDFVTLPPVGTAAEFKRLLELPSNIHPPFTQRLRDIEAAEKTVRCPPESSDGLQTSMRDTKAASPRR